LLLKYLYSDTIDPVAKFSSNDEDFVKLCENYAKEHMQHIEQFLSGQQYVSAPKSRMSNDMRKIFNDERFSDVTFKINNEIIKAHKVVLCSHSEYFRAMCLGGLRESTQQQIEIHDTPPFAFKKLIQYLYTKQINIEELCDNIVEMFIVADKFGCVTLKEHLELVMTRNITVENVSLLFLMADRCNAPRLKRKSGIFIQENYKKVKRTRKYKENSEQVEQLLKMMNLLQGDMSTKETEKTKPKQPRSGCKQQ